MNVRIFNPYDTRSTAYITPGSFCPTFGFDCLHLFHLFCKISRKYSTLNVDIAGLFTSLIVWPTAIVLSCSIWMSHKQVNDLSVNSAVYSYHDYIILYILSLSFTRGNIESLITMVNAARLMIIIYIPQIFQKLVATCIIVQCLTSHSIY